MEAEVGQVDSQKKLKVMFIHEVSYEAKVVFEMHEFPEFLAKRGHDVVFVDFPEHKIGWRSLLNKDQAVKGRAVLDSQVRLYSLANLLPSIFGRILAVFLAWIQIPQLMKKERPDVVILYGVPTNGIQTIWTAHRQGIPVIHRSIDVSHLLREGFLSRFITRFEKRVFERSDLIIANNAALASYISSVATPKRAIRVLSPGILNMGTSSIGVQEEGKFDFVFMGTLFRFSGLDWFITEMSKETESNQTSLLIIGDGEDGERLRGIVRDLDLQSRVEFTGFVQFSDLKSEVLRGRVGLLTFLEVPVAKYALPGKVLQYVRFGIPTISTRLDGLMSYLPAGHGVRYVKPGPDFLIAATELARDTAGRDELIRKGNETLDEKADWSRVIDSLENVLYELTMENRVA